MELSKKTTILFSPELYERLTRLAARKGTSLGQLVREACIVQYGMATEEERVEAVEELSELSLPVGSAEQLERESVPTADELLPGRGGGESGGRRGGRRR